MAFFSACQYTAHQSVIAIACFVHGLIAGDGREEENKKAASAFQLLSVLLVVHEEQSCVSKGNRERKALTRAFSRQISCFQTSARVILSEACELGNVQLAFCVCQKSTSVMLLWGLNFFSDHPVMGRRDSNRYSLVGLGGVTAAYLAIPKLAWVQKAVNLQQNRLQHAGATHGCFCCCLFRCCLYPS